MLRTKLSFTLIIAGCNVVSGISFAANDGRTTLPSSIHLKTASGKPVGYFKSEELRTSQNNIATGNHEFTVKLDSNQKFPILVESKMVKPGSSLKMSKDVVDGTLQFEVSPAEKDDLGKVNYQVFIPNIKSIDDRFWSPYTPEYTKWSDTGDNVDYSNWNPPINNQMSDFIQARTYNDVYSRTRQDREKDSNVGEIRLIGDPVTEYEKRKSEEKRSVKALVSKYVNTGKLYDCTEWVPSASETYQGLNVNQTLTCKQNQVRNWTYKVDNSIIGTHPQNKTIINVQSRTEEGTKNPWLKTSSTFTEWNISGAPKNYTSWTPVISNQKSNFTQSRSYEQEQSRIEQPREENAVTGLLRDKGNTVVRRRIIESSETRTVNVTSNDWENSGAPYNCGVWSPNPNTVNRGAQFTQSRNCNQMKSKTWNYKALNALLTSRQENMVVNINQTRAATGTKATYGNWVQVQKSGRLQIPNNISTYEDTTGLKFSNRYNPDNCNVRNGKRWCQFVYGQKCVLGSYGFQVGKINAREGFLIVHQCR